MAGIVSSKNLEKMEVVNICNGQIIGYINDIEIEISTGRIVAFIVPKRDKFFAFGKCDETVIPWDKVEKIGNDIILVNLGEDFSCYKRKCK